MNPTIGSRFSATTSPPITPAIVPVTPMINPSRTNIFMMLGPVAPMDLRMAISLFFSITTIKRVEAMPKAATSTIRVRMMNITTFSVFRAKRMFLFICIQSLA